MNRSPITSLLKRIRTSWNREEGFSLIEVLTTILLFSIIMTAVGSIFVHVMKSQRRGFTGQLVQENVTFVLESMAREIRVSTIQGSPVADCSATFLNTLTISHPVNGTVIYSLSGTRIQRTQGGVATFLSSADVAFTKFNFCFLGSGPTDDKQARVAILARVESVPTSAANKFSVDIQTTVTSRDIASELQN